MRRLHTLKPSCDSNTFDQYASKVIISYVEKTLENTSRCDIVWDRYIENSIKKGTRDSRGKGVRTKVLGNGRIPSNWDAVLRDENNKRELFHLLAGHIFSHERYPAGKVVVTTWDDKVFVNPVVNQQQPIQQFLLERCNHEEFDTRVFLHAANAAEQGYKRLLIRANDTDVVVLALALFDEIAAEKLWVAFGRMQTLRFLSIHDISKKMPAIKRRAQPAFHALSGCDTISFLAGVGKKTFYEKWRGHPEFTNTLSEIMSSTDGIKSKHI